MDYIVSEARFSYSAPHPLPRGDCWLVASSQSLPPEESEITLFLFNCSAE